MLSSLDISMGITAIVFLMLSLFCSSRSTHWKNKVSLSGDKALVNSIVWELRGDIFIFGVTLLGITLGIVLVFFLLVFTALVYVGLSGYIFFVLFLPSWDQHKKELVEVQYKRYQNQ